MSRRTIILAAAVAALLAAGGAFALLRSDDDGGSERGGSQARAPTGTRLVGLGGGGPLIGLADNRPATLTDPRFAATGIKDVQGDRALRRRGAGRRAARGTRTRGSPTPAGAASSRW